LWLMYLAFASSQGPTGDSDGMACMELDGCLQPTLVTQLLNLPKSPDITRDPTGGHRDRGWGGGGRPSLGKRRRGPRCSGCAPPGFHLPGWRRPLADTTTVDICGAHRGRAVTPTGVGKGSGGARRRPGMAAAAHTGSLPVHPVACASSICMLLSLWVRQGWSRDHARQLPGSRRPRLVADPVLRVWVSRALTRALTLTCTLCAWPVWHHWPPG
jgi:hypothetical protein